MAKKRFKPSAKQICMAVTADSGGRIHTSDLSYYGGRGMRPWLEKHGHIKPAGGAFYYLTRKGKKLGDSACNVDFGLTSKGTRRKR